MKEIYAVPGETRQHICKARHAPSGAVSMDAARPSEDHVCFDRGDGTGVWAIDPNKVWERDMVESDNKLPRWAEDIWDVIGVDKAPPYIRSAHEKKKQYRARKPK